MDTLQYARDLIAFESPSHLSNVVVTEYVEEALRQIGFATERIDYEDDAGVAKASVVGKKGDGTGGGASGVAYFGHTDVVPADDWLSAEHSPFEPTVKDQRLYGRGSCDMKGSIACMLTAASRFDAADLRQPLYIVCTADEEIGYGGARQVAEQSAYYREMVATDSHGIIGEPTMLEVVNAHKGTYGLRATARGRASHSSTRQGVNANLAMIPFLAEMKQIYDETESDPAWQDEGFDPPTISWNIGINDHTRAINVTAPQSVCTVYLRPTPELDVEPLIERAQRCADAHGIELLVKRSSEPLYTDPGSDFVRQMLEVAGRQVPGTVCYGTDGGVLGELKHRVLFGPGDIAQAHTNDEWISLEQLDLGTEKYTDVIRRWCCS